MNTTRSQDTARRRGVPSKKPPTCREARNPGERRVRAEEGAHHGDTELAENAKDEPGLPA